MEGDWVHGSESQIITYRVHVVIKHLNMELGIRPKVIVDNAGFDNRVELIFDNNDKESRGNTVELWRRWWNNTDIDGDVVEDELY